MTLRLDKSNLTALLAGLLTAMCVFVLLNTFFQKTVSRVLVQGFFPKDTIVTVSAISNSGNIDVIDTFEFKAHKPSAQPQYEGTSVLNVPVGRLQLDFALKNYSSEHQTDSNNPERFSLYSIQLTKPYSADFYFVPAQINLNFESAQAIKSNHAIFEFDTANGKVSLKSKNPISLANYPLILGLPIVFFFGVWFLVRNSAWRQIPAFRDMSLGNRISSASEFNTINGVRGLAALLVLLSHTAPGWEALQMGLALLFVVSGFLLSKPFVIDNHKIFSFANIERYVTKRLKRILPMYYLFVFITYVLTFKFDVAFRHFLFIQAEGHLWPMTQIFAFYMLLPLVLLVCCAAHKVHRVLPLVLLTIGTYYSITLMHGWMPFFNGTYSHAFFLYAFLMGILASYVQYDVIRNSRITFGDRRWARELVGLAAIAITACTILWSAPITPPTFVSGYLNQFHIKCLLSAIIILLALNTSGTPFNILISNWLFRSVGVIGFSFYILHGLGMQIADHFALQFLGSQNLGGRSWEFVAGAFFITYLMAIVTYSYVERPFFGYREKTKNN